MIKDRGDSPTYLPLSTAVVNPELVFVAQGNDEMTVMEV